MCTEKAVLGGGCFWCLEAVFKKLKGIKKVQSGYFWRSTVRARLQPGVCGKPGHSEVIMIEFDPDIISYQPLLEVFSYIHDPTTPNRQGNDIGTQYHSIIFTTSRQQHQQAINYIKQLNQSRTFLNPVVTEVKPLEKLYPAKDYHQDYFSLNRQQPCCQAVIGPKLQKFLKKYHYWIK